jgi:hypothetical protein
MHLPGGAHAAVPAFGSSAVRLCSHLSECLALHALARCAVSPARCALAAQPHTQCAAPDAYTAFVSRNAAIDRCLSQCAVVRWLFTHPLLLLALLASLALGVVYGADAVLFRARAARACARLLISIISSSAVNSHAAPLTRARGACAVADRGRYQQLQRERAGT